MIIRKAHLGDEIGIAKVHVDTWNSSYRGLISDEYLDKLNYPERELKWKDIIVKDTLILLVAEAEAGNIVGYVYGGANRETDSIYKGELYAIYILKDYQQRGIGKLLFTAFAKELKVRGYNSMKIWVLSGNPAYRFYEKLGGFRLGEKNDLLEGKSYRAITYGWIDLNSH